MKTIRVPWIQCRADEFGTLSVPINWRGKDFQVVAYSEKEANDWWNELSDRERSRQMGDEDSGDGPAFF